MTSLTINPLDGQNTRRFWFFMYFISLWYVLTFFYYFLLSESISRCSPGPNNLWFTTDTVKKDLVEKKVCTAKISYFSIFSCTCMYTMQTSNILSQMNPPMFAPSAFIRGNRLYFIPLCSARRPAYWSWYYCLFIMVCSRNGGFQDWHDGNVSRNDTQVGDRRSVCTQDRGPAATTTACQQAYLTGTTTSQSKARLAHVWNNCSRVVDFNIWKMDYVW